MEKKIIAELNTYLSKSSLDMLSREVGFNEPNNFSISEIQKVLTERKMPSKTEAKEFAWAIHECGVERLRVLESGAKLLSVVLFLYCNRVIETFGDYDEAYYFILLEEGLGRDSRVFCEFLMRIFSWLQDCGGPPFLSRPDQDFWLYLSMNLVGNTISSKENRNVDLKNLERLICAPEFIRNCGTDMDDGVQRWSSILEKSNLGELSQLFINEALTPWSKRF